MDKKEGALDGQFKVLLGGKSIDDFLSILSSKLNAPWIPASGFPRRINLSGLAEFTLYIDSSFGGPTIQIEIGGLKFKIRLQ